MSHPFNFFSWLMKEIRFAGCLLWVCPRPLDWHFIQVRVKGHTSPARDYTIESFKGFIHSLGETITQWDVIPASTIHQPDVGPMLGQRRTRWNNIGRTLGWCIVLAGMLHCVFWYHGLYYYSWFNSPQLTVKSYTDSLYRATDVRDFS